MPTKTELESEVSALRRKVKAMPELVAAASNVLHLLDKYSVGNQINESGDVRRLREAVRGAS